MKMKSLAMVIYNSERRPKILPETLSFLKNRKSCTDPSMLNVEIRRKYRVLCLELALAHAVTYLIRNEKRRKIALPEFDCLSGIRH